MAAKAKDILSTENRILVVREYANLWQQFFTFFSEDLRDRQITQQEEQEFQQIVSVLALNHYKFEVLSADVFKDAGKITDVLSQTVNLNHIKNLPDATFSKIQVDWHTLFLGMHKALGKLLNELPPKRLAELQQQGVVG
ncbi:MAG: hypothetical protein RLY93_20835 [Sumerlaeia bacterium]